LKIKPYGSKI